MKSSIFVFRRLHLQFSIRSKVIQFLTKLTCSYSCIFIIRELNDSCSRLIAVYGGWVTGSTQEINASSLFTPKQVEECDQLQYVDLKLPENFNIPETFFSLHLCLYLIAEFSLPPFIYSSRSSFFVCVSIPPCLFY